MHKNAQDSVVGWGKDFQFTLFQKKKVMMQLGLIKFVQDAELVEISD
jgi:hypothetical protein